jgi:hypothetical protein
MIFEGTLTITSNSKWYNDEMNKEAAEPVLDDVGVEGRDK